MIIGLYYKDNDQCSYDSYVEFTTLLKKASIDYFTINDNLASLNNCNLDLVVVFGGDGSVLRASKFVYGNVPLVAVNTGNLGFLSSYEKDNLIGLVGDIVDKKLTFKRLKFMAVTFNDKVYLALNDAVITKNHMVDSDSECIRLGLKIDGQFVDRYVGDGLILSTPTGSTAYAISAGGPIMVPNVSAYVVAPICAHSLHSKPIVYSQDSVAEVIVSQNSKECALFVDGKMQASLKPGAVVKITASEEFANICDNSGKFFSRLSQKLNKWSNIDLLEVDHG